MYAIEILALTAFAFFASTNNLIVNVEAFQSSELNWGNPSLRLRSRKNLNCLNSSEENKKFSNSNEFNVALYDYTRRTEESGDIELAFQAEKLLKDTMKLDKQESNKLANAQSYNIVLKGWRIATQKLAEGRAVLPKNIDGKHHDGGDVYTARDAAQRAHKLLLTLEHDSIEADNLDNIKPDVTGYNTVIDAWSKTRLSESYDKASNILHHMQSLRSQGLHLQDGTYSEPWDWLKPDIITYNAIIDTCVNFNHKDVESNMLNGPDTAEQIFHEMKTKAHLLPNTRTYNNLINVWSKNIDPYSYQSNERNIKAVERAEQLLHQLNNLYEKHDHDPLLRPDVATYTTVIDCIARSQIKDAPQKAEAWLEKLEQKYQETQDVSLQPNIRTYTSVIHAWSRSKHPEAPHRAEEILKKIDVHNEGQDNSNDKNSMIPNTRTYTMVISCWVRSQELSKPQKALQLLKHVSDQYKLTKDPNIQPNTFIYNAVIDACAKCPAREHDFPDQQRAALKIAFAVFKALQIDPHAMANHITYSTLLKAVNNLLPRIPYYDAPNKEQNDNANSRKQIVKKLFESCKKDGLIDPNVLKQMRQCTDSDEFLELIGEDSPIFDKKTGRVDFSKMPQEWGKHVN